MNQRVLLLVLLAWIACVHPNARGDDAPTTSGPVLDFTNDVMPLISRLGCNQASCHGSVQGKGGLSLSLFGGAAADDYAALTRLPPGRRVNLVEPEKSLLLAKATATIPHGGGQKVPGGSADYDVLRTWIAQALRGVTSTVHAS